MSNTHTSTIPTPAKTVVVFGATGNIGKAFIEQLSTSNTASRTEYNIIALSRNASSSTSTRLASLPGVQVRQVDKDNQDQPLRTLTQDLGLNKGDIYGIFSLQGYVSYSQDIAQGKAIADAAVALAVPHLIYLSTDFGLLPDVHTSILEVKRVVENHIKSLSSASTSSSSPLSYTILHPAQFMDNLLPTAPFTLKMSRTMLIYNTFKQRPERKHQMVSTRDIGKAGAVALRDRQRWGNREMRIAGDEFDMDELRAIYKEVMGSEVECANTYLTGFVRRFVPPLRGLADFFDQHGYNIDIEQSRRDVPDLDTLKSFLQRYKNERQQE